MMFHDVSENLASFSKMTTNAVDYIVTGTSHMVYFWCHAFEYLCCSMSLSVEPLDLIHSAPQGLRKGT